MDGEVHLGGVAGYVGYSVLPKKPMDKTLTRVKRDVNQLKEHIA